MIPVPGTLFGESNLTPAMSWRGTSPRGALTPVTYLGLGLGFEVAHPKKAFRETRKATKSTIRKLSAICTLGWFQECQAWAEEGIRNGEGRR